MLDNGKNIITIVNAIITAAIVSTIFSRRRLSSISDVGVFLVASITGKSIHRVAIHISDVTIKGFSSIGLNDTSYHGGAVNLNNIKHAKFSNVTFISNTGKSGGAIFMVGGSSGLRSTLEIENCIFTDNSVSGKYEGGDMYTGVFGGAVFAYNALVTIKTSKFTSNVVHVPEGYGGAVALSYLYPGSIISGNYFTKNTASRGSAVAVGQFVQNTTSSISISGNTFTLNNATVAGTVYWMTTTVEPG